MITRRHFLSSCAVTAAIPCGDAAAQITVPFNITVTTAAQSPIIPATRTTLWQPGVTYNAIPGVTTTPGIPHRTTIYKTLSPLGGGQDDSAQINAAITAAPDNTVIQLSAGVFTIVAGIWINRNNVTLRGAGPGKGTNTGGTFVADPTATQLYAVTGAPWVTHLVIGFDIHAGTVGTANEQGSYLLAQDAVKGTHSCVFSVNPGASVGDLVVIDMNTDNDPDVWWGNAMGPPGDGSRRWFCRQDRSINQVMKITAIAANTPSTGQYTYTFETPFHNTFKVAYAAEMTRYTIPWVTGVGVEEMYFFGGGNGDWQCAVTIITAQYCWVKHIETQWNEGSGHVGFHGSYRCELRDSYMHEGPHEYPGGGGYLTSFNWCASDNLIENCIMWKDNKVDVMRGAGGGNVIAYCYMDDAYGNYYPQAPEAGVNAGHFTCTSFALLEGNYSHQFKGDDYWGNSIYITIFRNHLSAIRAAHPPLNTYTYNDGSGHIYPYMDLQGRVAVDMQANSFYHNFVGNVLGNQGQVLLSYSGTGYSYTQTAFAYEVTNVFPTDGIVYMWQFGLYKDANGNWLQNPTTIQTQLRNGNWDWVTGKQIWYANIGDTGSTSTGSPQTIPNSLYLTAAPPFFGSNPWPWVNPATGVCTVLPAKARFDAGTPNSVQ
jgi:hypothetical protein